MADFELPAQGTAGKTNGKVSTVTSASGTDVQNFQLVTAVEGGSITPIASGNPLEVAIVGTVPISGAPTTVTANLGTLNGAATQTTSAAILAALGTPLQAGGNVVVTGTVPLPTGASTAAGLTTINTTLGTPLQAGGNVVVTGTVPLPTGASTEATLAAVNTKLGGTLTVTGGGTPLDLTATGSLTGTGTVAITGMNAMSTVMAQITGGANATFAFEGTVDGTNWALIPYVASNSPTTGWVTTTGTTSSTAIYEAQISGLVGVRINVNSYVSGTVGVAMRASNGMLTRPNVSIVGGVALLAGVASVGTVGLNAGTQLVGKVGIDQTTPGTTNNVTSSPVVAGTATLTQVAGSASTGTIIAANASRKAAVIVNDSTAILYLAFAATATTGAYTYKLASQATLELPTAGRAIYQGLISGIWTAANGNAVVTDMS